MTGHGIGQSIAFGALDPPTPGKLRQGRAVPWPSTSAFRPVRLRYGGRIHRVRIFCLNRGSPRHHHRAMAKVNGEMIEVNGGTEDEALAAFIKRIDPEVEIVKNANGNRLAVNCDC
jgi:hypothetical protein